MAAELAGILAGSDASLAPAHTGDLQTPAQKAGWWDARISLDARLAALLSRLDASWLGPWRCVSALPLSGVVCTCLAVLSAVLIVPLPWLGLLLPSAQVVAASTVAQHSPFGIAPLDKH